jgi:hypothetical protein
MVFLRLAATVCLSARIEAAAADAGAGGTAVEEPEYTWTIGDPADAPEQSLAAGGTAA